MCTNCKKYLTEFIGTFFLVFTVGAMVLGKPEGAIAPIAIGFALAVMVYAGGHVSGGHYNPAVSLAAAIRGALPYKNLTQYIIAQLLGGAAAIFLAARLFVMPDMCIEFDSFKLIIGELLFTFALCYVVLLCTTSKAAEKNSYFGFAIGSTVTVGAFAVGSICLAAFNPAVALSLGLIGFAGWNYILITIATNLAAGTIAAFAYKAVEECNCKSKE